jgi:hypothetical protein
MEKLWPSSLIMQMRRGIQIVKKSRRHFHHGNAPR